MYRSRSSWFMTRATCQRTGVIWWNLNCQPLSGSRCHSETRTLTRDPARARHRSRTSCGPVLTIPRISILALTSGTGMSAKARPRVHSRPFPSCSMKSGAASSSKALRWAIASVSRKRRSLSVRMPISSRASAHLLATAVFGRPRRTQARDRPACRRGRPWRRREHADRRPRS